MNKKIVSCFLYCIIFAIIFTIIDLFWISVYKNFIKKNNKKTTFIDIYYLLMGRCKYFKQNTSNVNNLKIHTTLSFYVFLFYFSISFFILFTIMFILKYDIIQNTDKYNYYYLLNVFILIIFFIIYYSQGSPIESPTVNSLLNKYLTPEEKIIYKKTWGDI